MRQDKFDIIELLNLYAVLLDSHRWDLFDLIFTDDVEADFGHARVMWSDLGGLKSHFATFHEQFSSHQHQMVGHVVTVDGDRAHAFSYGNWLLERDMADGESSWRGTGWYDDELVRTEGGWRIRRRTVRLVSWTGNPFVRNPNYDPKTGGEHVLRRESQAGKIGYLEALAAKHSDPVEQG